MSSNFIISFEGVMQVDGSVSVCEFFVSKKDLRILMDDSEVRNNFLKSLGRDKVVISHLGDSNDNQVFSKNYKKFLEVGVNRWR